jgi:hypothetical protein
MMEMKKSNGRNAERENSKKDNLRSRKQNEGRSLDDGPKLKFSLRDYIHYVGTYPTILYSTTLDIAVKGSQTAVTRTPVFPPNQRVKDCNLRKVVASVYTPMLMPRTPRAR